MMTVEAAIYCLESYVADNRATHCAQCMYSGDCHSKEAHEMALEAIKAQEDSKHIEYGDLDEWY